jgi:hypothetical protein
VASPNKDIAFDVDEASAEALRELTENAGALVCGRRLDLRLVDEVCVSLVPDAAPSTSGTRSVADGQVR